MRAGTGRPGLVIFDCDGVLVDSEPISIAVLVDILADAGLAMQREEAYRLFLGRSMASIGELLAADFGFDLGPAQLDAMRAALYRRFREELRPIAGVADALRRLTAAGCRVCVASSSQPERIRLSLSLTGLLDLLEPHIYSAVMVERGKPAPDLFLHAARDMGVAPADCVVIEDSPAGIAAARAAGMHVFGFSGGSHAAAGRLPETLPALSPHLVFDDMARLPGLLERLPAPARALICAVDVGTGSARAGIFGTDGGMHGRGERPIAINRPDAVVAEHDSSDIWDAVCAAVKDALAAAQADPAAVRAIGFDATCSLVARDMDGRPLSVSASGEPRWDTIVWLDHRALAEADECTATGHAVLASLGGVMSPEMQTPKLMWLKRNLPERWSRAGAFFDLADFLTFRATGNPARSQCTLACKWTWGAGRRSGWHDDFFAAVGLEDLRERAGLPDRTVPVGASIGRLTAEAAAGLGLTEDCVVAAGLIDAYAGALGLLGARAGDGAERHLALIAGTSSCIMAMSREARPVPGGWGPCFGAGLPDRWIVEAGQSATGALLDHVIRIHGGGLPADGATHRRIAARIAELRAAEPDLAARLHVLPDFHGNRSPLADPHALGVVSGLALDASFDGLCRLYWRTCVGIAFGVRQILESMNAAGFAIDTLHVTGGHVKNPLLMELYADLTGCWVEQPAAEDAVLAGTAMAAAAAAGCFPDVLSACAGMTPPGHRRKPDPAVRARCERDYAVFLAMQRQRRELDLLLRAGDT
jgi:FGGY-family pentulose kinase/HAD superfamily hydrolase (TIGR01509 family)